MPPRPETTATTTVKVFGRSRAVRMIDGRPCVVMTVADAQKRDAEAIRTKAVAAAVARKTRKLQRGGQETFAVRRKELTAPEFAEYRDAVRQIIGANLETMSPIYGDAYFFVSSSDRPSLWKLLDESRRTGGVTIDGYA